MAVQTGSTRLVVSADPHIRRIRAQGGHEQERIHERASFNALSLARSRTRHRSTRLAYGPVVHESRRWAGRRVFRLGVGLCSCRQVSSPSKPPHPSKP